MSHNKWYTLGDIAERLNIELRGDGSCRISSLGTLKSAQAGQLSFLSNSSYVDQLADCQASAVILPPDLADRWPGNALLTEAPYVAFAHASALFAPDAKRDTGVHPGASVASDAVLAEGVSIAANAVVGSGARIGEGSSIGAGSVIGAGARIGANCRLQANVTLYRE
ncbi:MAG: LpxD N-terminal domain-containing protein, partial [Pseudohongiellaceae bacterium]